MNRLWIILLLFVSLELYAQETQQFEPDSIKRVVEATQIAGQIKVDGVLDEPEWSRAKLVSDFIQIEPFQGEPAIHPTELGILYNTQYLYLGIYARDSLGRKSIRATDFKRDFDFKQHDLVTIAIDAFNDNRNSMAFVTNPYGVQRDLLGYDDMYYNLDWDGLWYARSTRTDSGWIAEMAIPWQTLRYPETEDSIQSWGFNMYRNRRMTNEISAFSPFPRSVSILRMNYAGVLTGLRPPPPKPNIRIHPYFLSSYSKYGSSDDPEEVRENRYEAGGELKWAINPNSVLDLTVNTDFAQADVDRQVNNLTRFSVFFPEKRQFFLENSSLFGISGSPRSDGTGGQMRIQPFFSRRIGLDESGNPIPIDAGARYVHRSARHNYGVMAMRQRKFNEVPAYNFLLGRYAGNFGKQSRIGGLFVMKNSKESTHFTSVIDGFFRLNQSHSINSLIVHTRSSSEQEDGFAGYLQYYYSTNQWKAWWTQSVVSEKFNPEMGFVSRSDIIGTTPGLIWQYRGDKLPLKGIIRAYEPGINLEMYHKASSAELLDRQINLRPLHLSFQSGAYLGYNLQYHYQNLTDSFVPLGIIIGEGEYSFTRHQLLLSSDPSKMFNVLADMSWGGYFNGHLQSYNLIAQFVPIPHISLYVELDRNYFDEVGDPTLTKRIDLISIEGRFAINPRLQLVGTYQKNTAFNSENYNIRFSWEYRPLSYVYLVINRREFDDLQQVHVEEDHIIAKINYLKQF